MRMYDLCKDRIFEKEDKLVKLERLINPLLDEDDQKGLNYILEYHVLGKIKGLKEATPFMKPVSKKQVKDYYEKIKKPMDLEMIQRKIKNNKYHSRYDFLADMELIQQNSDKYNGPTSTYSEQARGLVAACHELFKEYNDKLTSIEINIQKARAKAKDKDDNDTMDEDDDDDDMNSTFSAMDDDTAFSVQDDQEIDYPASSRDLEEVDDYYPNSVNESTRQSLRDDEEGKFNFYLQ